MSDKNYLRSSIFGYPADDPNALLAYSLRVDLETSAHIETISKRSGISKNRVICQLIKLGVSSLSDSFTDDEKSDYYSDVNDYITDNFGSKKSD